MGAPGVPTARPHLQTSRARPALLALLLLVVGARELSSPALPLAAVLMSGITVRTEGRAPVRDGRFDTAYQQALDEAFRRGVLEALSVIAPERQSPRDLETWQETVLSRAADFVGSWRILAQEQQDGFITLSAEIEIYRDKLARAARATGAAAATTAVRVMVLAESLPMVDRAADEELDAGGSVVAALEAELARRGAIIVATTDRAPWGQSSGPPSEENRVALATAAGRKLAADAVLIVQLTRRKEGLGLDAQLIATASETTLASARAEIPVTGARPLAEAFAQAARQVAAVCSPRLSSARPAHGAPPHPR